MTRAAGMGPLPRLLEEYGGSRSVVRAFAAENLPLALLEERHHLVPLVSLAGLFEHAARGAGDPVFGLSVGLAMDPDDYGLWVQYAMQAPSLHESILRLARSLVVHQLGGSIHLRPRPDGRVAFEYRHRGLDPALPVQHSDHVVPVMIRFVQSYLGRDWRPDWIEVPYARPAGTRAREDATATPWHFNGAGVALVLAGSDLAATRPGAAGADAADRAITSVEILAEAGHREAVRASTYVGAIIALRLLDGHTDIDGAAQRLLLGRRTLQRLLEEEGLNYRSLCERVRMARAKALIEETGRSLTQIAFDVGYSDLAHFTRAFGRCFGYPPSRLRRAACPGP